MMRNRCSSYSGQMSQTGKRLLSEVHYLEKMQLLGRALMLARLQEVWSVGKVVTTDVVSVPGSGESARNRAADGAVADELLIA